MKWSIKFGHIFDISADRDFHVDVLRGIAALSVLLGHAVQRGMIQGFDTTWVWKVIYSFHMPLFMMLSGYTLSFSLNKTNKCFILKKVRLLLYPTLIWSLLLWFFRKFSFTGLSPFITFSDSILEYLNFLIFYPDSIIWFLYIVFVFSTIIFICNKFEKIFKVSEIVLVIGILLVFIYFPISNFGWTRFDMYFPFFAIGYWISKHKIKIPQMNLGSLLILTSVQCIIIKLYHNPYSISYSWVVGFIGIWIVYSLVMRIKESNSNVVNKLLCIYGKYSLEIYLCQCLCLNIGFGIGIVKVFTIFISASIISLILSIFTAHFKITRILLYGRVI